MDPLVAAVVFTGTAVSLSTSSGAGREQEIARRSTQNTAGRVRIASPLIAVVRPSRAAAPRALPAGPAAATGYSTGLADTHPVRAVRPAPPAARSRRDT